MVQNELRKHRVAQREKAKKWTGLPRAEKVDLIRRATEYRSGADSCNSLYMGGMAMSALFSALGGTTSADGLDDLLAVANDDQLNEGLAVCSGYIEAMQLNPTVKCICCGQITTPEKVEQFRQTLRSQH